MRHTTDTIAAIITPPGQGGIAAVRIAGSDARSIAMKLLRSADGEELLLTPFRMQLGHLRDEAGHFIDEVMAVLMPSGQSYTGLEQVELFCHGGDLVSREILRTLLQAGARGAEPGEFTRIAFLNGKIDLTKAEAIAEMISAGSTHALTVAREHLLGTSKIAVESIRVRMVAIKAELEAAIDFADEAGYATDEPSLSAEIQSVSSEIETLLATYRTGRMLKDGFTVVLAGPPNAGKSSLFNRLVQYDRALVTPIAGTTRDFLTEWIELNGIAVRLVDTAGVRETEESVEQLGIDRTHQKLEEADLILWITDVSNPESSHPPALRGSRSIILVGNKIDKLDHAQTPSPTGLVLTISCVSGFGIEKLRNRISHEISAAAPDLSGRLVITSERQQRALSRSLVALKTADDDQKRGESAEIIAVSLQESIDALDEITGRIYTEEILGELFGRFCIGK